MANRNELHNGIRQANNDNLVIEENGNAHLSFQEMMVESEDFEQVPFMTEKRVLESTVINEEFIPILEDEIDDNLLETVTAVESLGNEKSISTLKEMQDPNQTLVDTKTNSGNKLKHKYLLVASILSSFAIFVVVMGVSYSFFASSVKGKEFIVYTGNLSINYAKKTDVIDIENLYPMIDKDGLKLSSHEFTIINNGNIDARYQIRLELDNTIRDMIDTRYIKISYQENDGEYSTPVLLSDLNSSLVFIKDIVLAPNMSNSYGIKLWIDFNAPNDIQGKLFKAKIVVDSIQNVEDGYVIDTAPIIYLNALENGNQDIHLKTNDIYTELGVARVEDDQEIFSTNQVAITYEYYDGSNLIIVDHIDTSRNGIYYVIYSITDKSGNLGRATRIVTVNPTDNVPDITLKGEASIDLGEKDYYKENGVTVEEGNRVIIIGEVKTGTVGSYIIKYIVMDANGSLNSVTRTVNVINSYQESILNGTDPVLTSSLIPVVIDSNGTVKKASTASNWYSYAEKNWANAVVLKDSSTIYTNNEIIPEDNIESYFVWIPRYKYKIFNEGNYTEVTGFDTAIPKAIEIVFENKNTQVSTGSKVGEYLTHPAFQAFDTNGMWVGKFETGYEGASTTSAAQVNSSDSSKIIIKPNVYSWRYITVGNAFEVSYNYLRSEESHMMKNTEWGAMAYLTNSNYGRCTNGVCSEVRINNNSNFITGYAGTEDPTLGYNNGISIEGNRVEGTIPKVDGTYTVNYLNNNSNVASTTGNKSGIYDVSGGTLEYVMGYTTGASTIGGASEITSIHPDFFTNSKWSKYYDQYTSTANKDYNNRILGDATGEMGPFGVDKDPDNSTRYRSSWYKDSAYFANSFYPWFRRGGNWCDGLLSGTFSSTYYTGSVYGNSFRVVLAP